MNMNYIHGSKKGRQGGRIRTIRKKKLETEAGHADLSERKCFPVKNSTMNPRINQQDLLHSKKRR